LLLRETQEDETDTLDKLMVTLAGSETAAAKEAS
jgi:hypothetical protein